MHVCSQSTLLGSCLIPKVHFLLSPLLALLPAWLTTLTLMARQKLYCVSNVDNSVLSSSFVHHSLVSTFVTHLLVPIQINFIYGIASHCVSHAFRSSDVTFDQLDLAST
ncbi:MAG: hypothetical protein JOS17DRAFT_445737 [Linnemannia elongata]|nr:MAG: hypothetical protein JOS17DRAFT_445737 [Linnemannia elongata]